MPNLAIRIAVTLLFVTQMAAAFVLGRAAGKTPPAPSVAGSQYGFRFEEVSSKAGVRTIHHAPELDPSLKPIMAEVASMGAAVSVVDFDKDGWPDIYVTDSAIGSRNHLYHNNHDGTFTDVAEQMGVADVNQSGTGASMGAVWGDYDNDGYDDLFVYKWGRPELFHNDRGKGFTRIANAGLPRWLNANSACWVDYDRDGKLDLFIGGYYRDDLDLWHLQNTRIMPESFEYARNGGAKHLLRNMGNGRFEDVTAKVGLDSHRWALAVAAADLRGTGYPDLFIANDYGVPEFWANHEGKRFTDIAPASLADLHPKSGMNVAFGDVFNQGRFCVYNTNISEPGTLVQGNNLWVPDASSSGDGVKYINMASDMGVDLGGWSFGAQFGDLNNDGLMDLFLTNGYISQDPKKSYWSYFSKVAMGNTAIIGDAKNWPAIEDMSHSGYQTKRVWVNVRRGSGGGSEDAIGRTQFVDVAPSVGVTETNDGRAVAMADFWNRGVLDVVVAHQRGPLLLYRNNVDPANQWIEFQLEGTRSNRSAIGAEVHLYWDGSQQLQQVSGGSGFCAQNMRRLHFGLGKDPKVEKAVIRWPSGKEQVLSAKELKLRSIVSVKEPA